MSCSIRGTARFLKYSLTWWDSLATLAGPHPEPGDGPVPGSRLELNSIHFMIKSSRQTIYIPNICRHPCSHPILPDKVAVLLRKPKLFDAVTIPWFSPDSITWCIYISFPVEITSQAWCLTTLSMNQTSFYLAKESKWDNIKNAKGLEKCWILSLFLLIPRVSQNPCYNEEVIYVNWGGLVSV